MFFWMLFVLAPIGVAAVLALSAALGCLGDARLGDGASARRCLADQDPEFRATDVALALDGRGAIFTGELEDDDAPRPAVAILMPLGDRFVSRVLGAGDVVAATIDGAGALRVETRDITRRTLTLPLAEGVAAAWLALLRELAAARPRHV